MALKIKICPKCGKEHTRHRADYCSNLCAKSRIKTEEDKEHQRKRMLEYHDTPEGQATREKASKFITAQNTGEEYTAVSVEDFAVDLPDFRTLDDYSEFLQNFDKGESW